MPNSLPDDLILNLLKRKRTPVAAAKIGQELGLPPRERRLLSRRLQQLVKEGKIIRERRSYRAAPPRITVQGKLIRHEDGSGHIRAATELGADVYIPRANMAGAANGDLVAALVLSDSEPDRPVGDILQIIKRARSTFLATIEQRGPRLMAEPLDPRETPVMWLAPGERGLSPGSVILAEIMEYPAANSRGFVRAAELLPPLEDPAGDFRFVCARYNLSPHFPPELDTLDPQAFRYVFDQPRADFRDRTTITIDPSDARDFDDALSCDALPSGGFLLGVHIADVSAFVTPHSEIDREGCERATSVYLPEGAIHMLPALLSSNLCSLQFDADRVTVSVMIELDGDGIIRDAMFHQSVIRSWARLSYEQVEDVLHGNDQALPAARDPAAVTSLLHRLRDVAARLLGQRRLQGALDFDLPEPEVQLAPDGSLQAILRRERLESHRIVEECMLAANTAVAQFLMQRSFGLLHRVHEAPDADKLANFASFSNALGQPLPRGGEISPAPLSRYLENLPRDDRFPFLAGQLLRCMKLARYDAAPLGHYALAKTEYTHFTSPIRRYPDLLVHRQLKAALTGDVSAISDQDLEWLAEHCSGRERNAEAAEREALQRKKVRFLRKRLGDCFSGLVTGVAPFGLFVTLTNELIEGLVHIRNLPADYYDYIPDRFALRGTRSGRMYKLGMQVEVRIARADLRTLEIDYVLIQ